MGEPSHVRETGEPSYVRELGEQSRDPRWIGLSLDEILQFQFLGVEVPEYAIDDLRERRRAEAIARCEQSRREEIEESRRRDALAIVPFVGRSVVGSDGAGPSRVRPEIPEEERPLRRRPRLSAIPEEPIEWRDIQMIPTPVLPIPVPSPVPSPLPSPDPFDEPFEQFTPPGHFGSSEEEEDPLEDADTEPVGTPPPPVAASPPLVAPPPATVPPPVLPPLPADTPPLVAITPEGEQVQVVLWSDYQMMQGRLAESRHMIDTLLQRLAGGRGGAIPDGMSLALVSIELRASGAIRRLLGDRGDPAWRAEVGDVVTSMAVQIRDVVRAGLP